MQMVLEDLSRKIDSLLVSRIDEEKDLPLVEQLYRVVAPISVQEAADLLGVSVRQVQRYRKRGELHCSGLRWSEDSNAFDMAGFRKNDLLQFARRKVAQFSRRKHK